MAASQGARCSNLRETISPNVVRAFRVAVETFETCQQADISPSLGTLRSVLVERRDTHM